MPYQKLGLEDQLALSAQRIQYILQKWNFVAASKVDDVKRVLAKQSLSYKGERGKKGCKSPPPCLPSNHIMPVCEPWGRCRHQCEELSPRRQTLDVTHVCSHLGWQERGSMSRDQSLMVWHLCLLLLDWPQAAYQTSELLQTHSTICVVPMRSSLSALHSSCFPLPAVFLHFRPSLLLSPAD